MRRAHGGEGRAHRGAALVEHREQRERFDPLGEGARRRALVSGAPRRRAVEEVSADRRRGLCGVGGHVAVEPRTRVVAALERCDEATAKVALDCGEELLRALRREAVRGAGRHEGAVVDCDHDRAQRGGQRTRGAHDGRVAEDGGRGRARRDHGAHALANEGHHGAAVSGHVGAHRGGEGLHAAQIPLRGRCAGLDERVIVGDDFDAAERGREPLELVRIGDDHRARVGRAAMRAPLRDADRALLRGDALEARHALPAALFGRRPNGRGVERLEGSHRRAGLGAFEAEAAVGDEQRADLAARSVGRSSSRSGEAAGAAARTRRSISRSTAKTATFTAYEMARRRSGVRSTPSKRNRGTSLVFPSDRRLDRERDDGGVELDRLDRARLDEGVHAPRTDGARRDRDLAAESASAPSSTWKGARIAAAEPAGRTGALAARSSRRRRRSAPARACETRLAASATWKLRSMR